jgi:protein translocase SecG subunit
MTTVLHILTGLAGTALIVSVLFQKSTTEGFAALGGGESGKYKKGGWDDFLEKVTKYAAVAWAGLSVILAVCSYHAPAKTQWAVVAVLVGAAIVAVVVKTAYGKQH